MAASSPVLMTVILAMAALHQSRTRGQGDLFVSMTFHDRCLELLVPMLGDSDRVKDDCVLITTTILQLHDGLECKMLINFSALCIDHLFPSRPRPATASHGDLGIFPCKSYVQFDQTS